jgi:hypothetical protein
MNFIAEDRELALRMMWKMFDYTIVPLSVFLVVGFLCLNGKKMISPKRRFDLAMTGGIIYYLVYLMMPTGF